MIMLEFDIRLGATAVHYSAGIWDAVMVCRRRVRIYQYFVSLCERNRR